MKVLLLNADYTPLNFINWKRALKLVVKDKGKAINTYSNSIIPSVVLLNEYKHINGKINCRRYFNRFNIWRRDNGKCLYCGKKIEWRSGDFTLDHVIPRSLGGTTDWSNIVSCCFSCNQEKSNKTIELFGKEPIVDPSIPSNSIPIIKELKNRFKAWKMSIGNEEHPEEWLEYIKED